MSNQPDVIAPGVVLERPAPTPERVSYGLTEVVDAFKYWNELAPPVDDALSLSPQASCVAGVLGMLWFHHRSSIACASLTDRQKEALAVVGTAAVPLRDGADPRGPACPAALEVANSDMDPAAVLGERLAGILRLGCEPGQLMIWRGTLLWHCASGPLPGHLASQSVSELARCYRYEVIADLNHGAIVGPMRDAPRVA